MYAYVQVAQANLCEPTLRLGVHDWVLSLEVCMYRR